jgi:hypothetical protein
MITSAADFHDIEIVERDAWLDLYAAAPLDAAAKLGLAYALKDDAALLILRRLDALTFNRLASLGVLSLPQLEALDEAIAAFDAAGVRNWVVQVPGGEKALEALCNARGLVPHRRVWAKFIRRPDIITTQTSLAVRTISREHAAASGWLEAAAPDDAAVAPVDELRVKLELVAAPLHATVDQIASACRRTDLRQ